MRRYVVKDLVIVGSSGAELGVRGYATAYDVKTGGMKWRKYATGPDEEIGIGDDFNKANPHYGQKGLGTSTWEGDAWKIGGGTNWGWYAYDPDVNLIYYGSGNPSPWNETMRPGDNKWTMTIMARDADSGELKLGLSEDPARRVGLRWRQRHDAVRPEGQVWQDAQAASPILTATASSTRSTARTAAWSPPTRSTTPSTFGRTST